MGKVYNSVQSLVDQGKLTDDSLELFRRYMKDLLLAIDNMGSPLNSDKKRYIDAHTEEIRREVRATAASAGIDLNDK